MYTFLEMQIVKRARRHSARSRRELKMRDRVFLLGRVTVVTIFFQSVLTAHALFHKNEDPMHVLMLNTHPRPMMPQASFHRRVSHDLTWPSNAIFSSPAVKGNQVTRSLLALSALLIALNLSHQLTCFPFHPAEWCFARSDKSMTKGRKNWWWMAKKNMQNSSISCS